MASSGNTTIQLYYSTTANSTPTAANLASGELALNSADGKLFYKDANNVVQVIATRSSGNATFNSITDTSLSANTIVYAGAGGLLSSSGNLAWNGSIVNITGGLNVSGNNVVFGSNAAITVPVGTTGQEPVSPSTGMFRFNLSTSQFEGYNGSAWGQVGGGATGGGSDQIFVLNGQTVTTNYTIPSGKNASTAGTVTINTGVVVTVSTGSRWVIV
jgi:hypothetical protein